MQEVGHVFFIILTQYLTSEKLNISVQFALSVNNLPTFY